MFKYFFKKIMRNRSFVFWSLMFPIALMTCFNFAFSNIYSSENSFDPVDAVYVNEDDVSVEKVLGQFVRENNLIQLMFKADIFEKSSSANNIMENITISDELKSDLDILAYGIIFEMVADNSECFNLKNKRSVEEARELINNGEARMILIVKDKDVRVELADNYSTVEANIASAFLATYKTEYQVMREMLKDVDLSDVDSFDLFKTDMSDEIGMKEIAKQKADIYDETPDPFNWYYYSTIVMGIMFNIITGIGIVADAEADISAGAMRISLSSSKKSVLLLNMFSARLVLCCIISAFQIVVANLVFKIPMGNRILELAIFIVLANMFALSVGMLAGLFLKGKVSDRENKANALLMTSVFLSGEMVNTLPGIFAEKAPWVNEINPATILNFAFYKLIYYGDLTGFYMNLAKIAAVTVLCIFICIVKMRRQKYASI